MNKEVLEKISNNEYISKHLLTDTSNLPIDFDVEKYNEKVLSSLNKKYDTYFNNMYKNINSSILLDINQRNAILADEKYSLIIAGAGTGKTTTIASKIKYLVDIKNIKPEKIAVVSFTKKAAEELERRTVVDFELPVKVTTFHSLAYTYIRNIFYNHKCYIVDRNERESIFLNYFQEKIFPYHERINEILEIFPPVLKRNWVFGNFFKKNYANYNNFNEYFEAYKKHKLAEVTKKVKLHKFINDKLDSELNRENIYTINNELVKSKGEAIIANFLFMNQIEYSYERIYEKLMNEFRPYRPDFTIDFGGEKIYIEYFGLSTYEDNEINQYQKIMERKIAYHKKHHNKFICLEAAPNNLLTEKLQKELENLGFTLNKLRDEEIFDAMLNRYPAAEIFQLKDFLYRMIDKIKEYPKRKEYEKIVNNYLNTLNEDEKDIAIKQFKYIKEFYYYYQNALFNKTDYGFDFSDLIYYTNQYIDEVKNIEELKFDYLIIDEYQDISEEKYEFSKNIINLNNGNLMAVGDDWQSIYAFNGSKIEYIYNFEKYFYPSKVFKINQTYRNSQSLINYSGNFIMKNPIQIKKDLISNKEINNPVKFVLYNYGKEVETMKRLIKKIHIDNPNHSITILARANYQIKECLKDRELKDSIGSKIEFIGFEEIDLNGMTMHKSKGLTCDEVIIIGLDNSFPIKEHNSFWLESLFKIRLPDEPINYAEERRLFYVALTRTKNYVYLLTNKNPKYQSPFINELKKIIKTEQQKNNT